MNDCFENATEYDMGLRLFSLSVFKARQKEYCQVQANINSNLPRYFFRSLVWNGVDLLAVGDSGDHGILASLDNSGRFVDSLVIQEDNLVLLTCVPEDGGLFVCLGSHFSLTAGGTPAELMVKVEFIKGCCCRPVLTGSYCGMQLATLWGSCWAGPKYRYTDSREPLAFDQRSR